MDERPRIVVQLPLRGEWFAPNTPGTRVPSHGTDRFGTRYAYDFVQADWKRRGWPAYRGTLLRYLLWGVPVRDYYCWGQAVYAPCDGVIVRAEDGWAERARTNLMMDTVRAYRHAHRYDPARDGVQSMAGNYIIMACGEGVYAGLVHLKSGSIRVRAGQKVKQGDMLGRVGHSGNSYMPHLHFQMMDSADIAMANGLPCAFECYEVLRGGTWQAVQNGVPKSRERIRFTGK